MKSSSYFYLQSNSQTQLPLLLGQGGQQNKGGKPGNDTENEKDPFRGGQPALSCRRGYKEEEPRVDPNLDIFM